MIFNKRYFVLTVLLFVTEILIAVYLHDKFIRPYGGDVLVVILIYCFIRTFFRWRVLPVAIGTLVFSFAVEIAQYFKIVEVLGLGHIKLARIIIGTDFAWHDLLAYVAGIAIVLACEFLPGFITRRQKP